jgi:hypothetical protein
MRKCTYNFCVAKRIKAQKIIFQVASFPKGKNLLKEKIEQKG